LVSRVRVLRRQVTWIVRTPSTARLKKKCLECLRTSENASSINPVSPFSNYLIPSTVLFSSIPSFKNQLLHHGKSILLLAESERFQSCHFASFKRAPRRCLSFAKLKHNISCINSLRIDSVTHNLAVYYSQIHQISRAAARPCACSAHKSRNQNRKRHLPPRVERQGTERGKSPGCGSWGLG
jgi:hypothetical protein